MSLSVLKTCSLGTVLVGRAIKRQRQPLAGRVIQAENIDRLLFAYFCEASSVNTACGNNVFCIKGIKRDIIDGQRASGEPDRRLQLAPEHTAGGRLHQLTGFMGRFSRLIPTVNCAVTLGLVQNSTVTTVIRENPTRCATYNPAGGGFHL